MMRYLFIVSFFTALSFVAFAKTNNYTISSLKTEIDTTYQFKITVSDSILLFEKSKEQKSLTIFISDEESNVLKDFVFSTDSLFLNIDSFDKATFLINIITEDFKKNNVYQLNRLTNSNE